jgi:hypothetical protein
MNETQNIEIRPCEDVKSEAVSEEEKSAVGKIKARPPNPETKLQLRKSGLRRPG